MKLNDVKHNHSLTDLLKILIFSILMMIPFIDVGVRCAYVICNKNAYQSYYGETINQKEYEETDVLLQDITYYINIPQGNSYDFTNSIAITVNSYNGDTNIDQILLYMSNGAPTVRLNKRDESTATWINLTSTSFNGNCSYVSCNRYDDLLNLNIIYSINYNDYSYLDNVFDYSVNKLTTSELYTWTQQTAIYTGVQTMCAQLGINNTVIPILFVYWFILTVIYIIVDIVIKLFTLLTHSIGSKTA